MGWVVRATPRPLYPRKRPGTYRTGGWVDPRAGGRERKISPPPGFDPWTVQPVASRYADWAIQAPLTGFNASTFHVNFVLQSGSWVFPPRHWVSPSTVRTYGVPCSEEETPCFWMTWMTGHMTSHRVNGIVVRHMYGLTGTLVSRKYINNYSPRTVWSWKDYKCSKITQSRWSTKLEHTALCVPQFLSSLASSSFFRDTTPHHPAACSPCGPWPNMKTCR